MNYGMPFGTSAALPYSPLAYRLNATPTSFVRLAEQQARPAFETLESTLQAVSSVLMVLESAYFTISNSFRAVLSIVDQFGRLKVQLKRITEAFVLLRLLKRAILCLRAKLLGIEAASKVDGADDCNESGDRPMSWPVLLFLLVAIGGPFLVWKLISSMLNLNGKFRCLRREEACGNNAVSSAASVLFFLSTVDCDSWRTGESEHYVAVADYDYTAEHNDELTVSSGDELRVAPKRKSQLQSNTASTYKRLACAETVACLRFFPNAAIFLCEIPSRFFRDFIRRSHLCQLVCCRSAAEHSRLATSCCCQRRVRGRSVASQLRAHSGPRALVSRSNTVKCCSQSECVAAEFQLNTMLAEL